MTDGSRINSAAKHVPDELTFKFVFKDLASHLYLTSTKRTSSAGRDMQVSTAAEFQTPAMSAPTQNMQQHNKMLLEYVWQAAAPLPSCHTMFKILDGVRY